MHKLFFHHFIRSLWIFLRQMLFISSECVNPVIAQKTSSIILNCVREVIFVVLAWQQNSSSPTNCVFPLFCTTMRSLYKLKKGNLTMGALTTKRTPTSSLQFLQLLMYNFLCTLTVCYAMGKRCTSPKINTTSEYVWLPFRKTTDNQLITKSIKFKKQCLPLCWNSINNWNRLGCQLHHPSSCVT